MTQTITDTKHEAYLEDIHRVPMNGHAMWFRQLRDSGAAAFKKTAFPNTRMEEWRHTNIAPIVNAPYRALLAPGAHSITREDLAAFFYGGGWMEAVFVDGFFCPALSRLDEAPQGLYIGGLATALEDEAKEKILEKRLGALLKSRNAFTELNSALFQDGAFLHARRNAVIETPIHLIFVTSARESHTAAHIRNLLFLESGSQADVVSSYVNLAGDTDYLNNVVDEVFVDANARLRWYKVVEEGKQGNHLSTAEIRQNRDSRNEICAVTLSGNIVRNQFCTRLEGEGGDCHITGLYLNDGDRLIDNALDITHIRPHCSSRIECKGILDDNSKAAFTGKIYVHPQAQKTDSRQLNNNLLLSDHATIDTKPQLEIYADDVKCTHGATVGAPPEEVIFYFRSRGISEQTARAMLTRGFAAEVLDEIALDAVRDRLLEYVFDKFKADR